MIVYTKKITVYVAMALYIIILSAFLGDKFSICRAMIPCLSCRPYSRQLGERLGCPFVEIVILGAILSAIGCPSSFLFTAGLDDAQAGLTRMASYITLQGQLWSLSRPRGR